MAGRAGLSWTSKARQAETEVPCDRGQKGVTLDEMREKLPIGPEEVGEAAQILQRYKAGLSLIHI